VRDFVRFTGIARPAEFRTVTRAHIIAWRDDLVRRGLGGSTIRHRLASLASLFESLREKNAVTHNPVKGVERPRTESGEGKTPAIGDHQARELLAAPQKDTIKSKRDRAILSTLLFHALRREELCKLKVRDAQHARKAVPHLRVSGKGGKTRYLPLHPGTHALIHDYLAIAGHGDDDAGALFRPVRNNRTGKLVSAITADGVYKLVRPIRRSSGSRSARTRCGRRPPPMPSTTRPTLPRFRNGSATQTSPPRASTIIGGRGRRTARLSKWRIRTLTSFVFQPITNFCQTRARRPMKEFLFETIADYFHDGLVALTKGDFVTTPMTGAALRRNQELDLILELKSRERKDKPERYPAGTVRSAEEVIEFRHMAGWIGIARGVVERDTHSSTNRAGEVETVDTYSAQSFEIDFQREVHPSFTMEWVLNLPDGIVWTEPVRFSGVETLTKIVGSGDAEIRMTRSFESHGGNQSLHLRISEIDLYVMRSSGRDDDESEKARADRLQRLSRSGFPRQSSNVSLIHPWQADRISGTYRLLR